MSRPGPMEQRSPYKGTPARPWVRIHFVGLDGTSTALELMADTGSPCPVVIGTARMAVLTQGRLADLNTDFGPLQGGWLRVDMPELGLNQFVAGYGSDEVMLAAQSNCSDFQGLVGLSLLRLLEYGGNADEFWIRRAAP